MSRREFSKPVKREALKRANGNCEGARSDGLRCDGVLEVGRFHYDHDIPDGLGGQPELWNCKVLCLVCHKIKTAQRDVPAIAKAKRVEDRRNGIRKPSRWPSRKAARPVGQHRATGKIEKWRGYAGSDR